MIALHARRSAGSVESLALADATVVLNTSWARRGPAPRGTCAR
jgi:hypothetical protein